MLQNQVQSCQSVIINCNCQGRAKGHSCWEIVRTKSSYVESCPITESMESRVEGFGSDWCGEWGNCESFNRKMWDTKQKRDEIMTMFLCH